MCIRRLQPLHFFQTRHSNNFLSEALSLSARCFSLFPPSRPPRGSVLRCRERFVRKSEIGGSTAKSVLSLRRHTSPPASVRCNSCFAVPVHGNSYSAVCKLVSSKPSPSAFHRLHTAPLLLPLPSTASLLLQLPDTVVERASWCSAGTQSLLKFCVTAEHDYSDHRTYYLLYLSSALGFHTKLDVHFV